jgi:hypothetical protein
MLNLSNCEIWTKEEKYLYFKEIGPLFNINITRDEDGKKNKKQLMEEYKKNSGWGKLTSSAKFNDSKSNFGILNTNYGVIDCDSKDIHGRDTLIKYGIDINKYNFVKTHCKESDGEHFWFKLFEKSTINKYNLKKQTNAVSSVDILIQNDGSSSHTFEGNGYIVKKALKYDQIDSLLVCPTLCWIFYASCHKIVDYDFNKYKERIESFININEDDLFKEFEQIKNEIYDLKNMSSETSTTSSVEDLIEEQFENIIEEHFEEADAVTYNVKWHEFFKLIPDKHFKEKHLWNEVGYALYNEMQDKVRAWRTWNLLLRERSGSLYNEKEAKGVWDSIAIKQKEKKEKGEKLRTTAHYRKIAGGNNAEAYKVWKTKFESMQKKPKSKAQITEEIEDAEREIILYIKEIISTLNSKMIYEDNGKSFSAIQSLDEAHINAYDLAVLIKQTYVNLHQEGNLFLVIKKYNTDRCRKKNEFMKNIAFSKVEFSKILDPRYAVYVRMNDEKPEVKFKLNYLLLKLSNVNDYEEIGFYPYNVKKEDNCPKTSFNMFKGFLHAYDSKFIPDKKVIELFESEYKVILCNEIQTSFDFEMKKLAHIFQNPQEKSESVSIFKGGQGIGKSFLILFLMQYVFGKQLSTVIYSSELLTARFNSHLMGKLFVILEEGVDLANPKDINKFKGMIRCPTFLVEHKGINVSDLLDCCMNFFILTNLDFNKMLSERDERVINYNVCNEKYKRDTKHFKEVSEVLYNFEAGKSIFHYLMNMDLSDFNVREVPESNTKLEKKIDASPSFIRYLYMLYKNKFEDDIEDCNLFQYKENSIPFYRNDEEEKRMKEEKEKNKLLPKEEVMDNFVKISTIMSAYKEACDNLFLCKMTGRETIKKQFLLEGKKLFEAQEYKSGQYEYKINSETVKAALNKYFECTEFK